MGDSAAQHSERGVMPDFDIRDYITSHTDGDAHQLDVFPDFHQQPSATPSPMNMESSMAPQNVLGTHNPIEYVSQSHPQTVMMAEMLKGKLQQQMKLQQLQQLQNHILQQQIELISSQSSMNDQHKDIIFHGLLTPGPSTELHAMVPKDLVSPMMLQREMYLNNEPSTTAIVNQISPHHHDLSMSAPAALAFQTSPPFPLPSPAEMDDDLSPLTSPWLLPVPAQQHQQHPDQHTFELLQEHPTRRKRAVSISGEDQCGMRKRPSPSVNSTGMRGLPGLSTALPSPSSSISPIAAVGRGIGSGNLVPPISDTPSPVDLSMPPPAPPTLNTHLPISSASSSTSLSATGSASASPNIAPVTPASIMNLGKLATGLVPSHFSASSPTDVGASMPPKRAGKSKPAARPKVAAANGGATRGRRGSAGIGSNLKPLLPGVSALPSSPLVLPTNPGHASSAFGSTSPNALPGPRKTSHKAAEQKRRDSLKTSFDELRLLLPPVPLPDDAGDEPPLPGSMPPRGPPKGDADGPNRGVSKLALLRCGNTYIRDLKGKVGRRDVEIERLRSEVRRLRTVAEDPGGPGVDLERDVDEGEFSVGPVGGYCEDGDEDAE